jgi:hypothetical protein
MSVVFGKGGRCTYGTLSPLILGGPNLPPHHLRHRETRKGAMIKPTRKTYMQVAGVDDLYTPNGSRFRKMAGKGELEKTKKEV